MPGVVKRLDLRRRPVTARPFEQHVVARVRIERRVQIDQVNRRILDTVAQHRKIIAIIQMICHLAPLPPAARVELLPNSG